MAAMNPFNQQPGFFKGTPGGFAQQSRFTPGIQQALNQNIMQLLSGLGNQDYLQGMAQEARKNFQQQTVPSIAERFTSLGEGAQSSGAFAGALQGAGADLEKQIALQGLGQQQQLQGQLLPALLGLGQMENLYVPGQQSGFQAMLPGLAQGLGRAAGAYFSGGASEILPILTQLLGLGG